MSKIFYRNLNGNNKLDITNWIAIREPAEDAPYLQVHIGTHVYALMGMTIDSFHKAVRSQKMTNAKYRYLHSSLSCLKCRGKTRLDWIEKSVGVKTDQRIPNRVAIHYMRDGRAPIRIFQLPLSYGGIYHLSSPKFVSGNELCNECKGTGIKAFGEAYPAYRQYRPKGDTPWNQLVIDVEKPPTRFQ